MYEVKRLTISLKISIMIKSPCNVYPLTPHFYIVKLGFTGVYIFFLIFALKHVLSKHKKHFLAENNHFYSREILQYIVWACYRNAER